MEIAEFCIESILSFNEVSSVGSSCDSTSYRFVEKNNFLVLFFGVCGELCSEELNEFF